MCLRICVCVCVANVPRINTRSTLMTGEIEEVEDDDDDETCARS